MKLEIKRMYDAIKAIEVEELKKKVEAVTSLMPPMCLSNMKTVT